MPAKERTALAGTELRHYTSAAAGALIDQRDGTVHVTPRRGGWAVLSEVFHLNWWVLLGGQRAVYFYKGVPTDRDRVYHRHANEVVVRVSGDDLLAHHRGQLHDSPHDSAVAVRGGYRGPGVTQSLQPNDTVIAPRTVKAVAWNYVRALVRGR